MHVNRPTYTKYRISECKSIIYIYKCSPISVLTLTSRFLLGVKKKSSVLPTQLAKNNVLILSLISAAVVGQTASVLFAFVVCRLWQSYVSSAVLYKWAKLEYIPTILHSHNITIMWQIAQASDFLTRPLNNIVLTFISCFIQESLTSHHWRSTSARVSSTTSPTVSCSGWPKATGGGGMP